MNEIANELSLSWFEQRPCVVATIIRVEGSAYQKDGVRCIIRQDGEIIGILSGGCIEEDIIEHSNTLFHSGTPLKLLYDFRADEDEPWGLGMGCNGAITVWLELFDPVRLPFEAKNMLEDFVTRDTLTKPKLMFTVLSSEQENGYKVGQRWSQAVNERVGDFEIPQTPVGISCALVNGKRVEVLVETILPAPLLSIIGVGADVAILSELAGRLGWRVQIVYHDTSRARIEKFPSAEKLVVVPRGNFISLAEQTDHYVIVMTHNLELDQAAVMQLLPQAEIVYLGILGSKSRIGRIMDHVDKEIGLQSGWMHKLFSPIGLDIGAKSPQEISLSIMAELIAQRNNRTGEPLRTKSESWRSEQGELSATIEGVCYG